MFVVIGHVTVAPEMRIYIYSFHMPLFFYVSGYLFNQEKYPKLISFISSKTKSLLVPYAWFSAISIILIYFRVKYHYVSGIPNIKTILSQVFYLNGSVLWNVPLWFLVCLFVVSVEYYLLRKLIKNDYMLIVCLAIISVIGYLAPSYLPFKLPFGLDISLTAIVFYGTGNIIRKKGISIKKPSLKAVVFTLLFAGSIIAGLNTPERVDMYYLKYYNYFNFYIAAFLGIAAFTMLSQLITKAPILTYFGRNSLIILATQYIIFWLIDVCLLATLKTSFYSMTPSTPRGLLISLCEILLSIPLIFIINKYIPFILGRKPASQEKSLKKRGLSPL